MSSWAWGSSSDESPRPRDSATAWTIAEGEPIGARSTKKTPVRVIRCHVGGGLNGQTGLPGAPRCEDREQPGLSEEALGLGQLRLPPDEVGQLNRQVVGNGIEGHQWWKRVVEPFNIELVHMLGPGQVLEAMLTHVDD